MAAARARPSVAILGCGAVGGTLAWELSKNWKRGRRQAELLLWSRRAGSVGGLREILRRVVAGSRVRVRTLSAPEHSFQATTAVVLCVPGEAIIPLARRLAHGRGSRSSPPPVLHTNGFLGPEALSLLQERGVAVGKLHPMVAANDNTALLEDVSFGIAGDAPALAAAKSIIRWVGGRPVLLPEAAGPDYHAAASLLSGGLVALFELADGLLARCVTSEESRRLALEELASSTLGNIEFDGTRMALTGALSRGDESTVRAHLLALRSAPEALEAYQVLGRTMLELARARGSIDAGAHGRLARLLRGRVPKR